MLAALCGCTLAAVLLASVALRLERRWSPPADHGRYTARARMALAAVVVIAGAAAVAAGLPDWLDSQRRAFAEGNVVPLSADPASRLTQVGNNGRLSLWRVGVDRFEAAPWTGDGAGTYRLAWERDRPVNGQPAVDGHSLYVEALAELGIPGLALVMIAVAAGLLALARGLRGAERPAHAAALGAGLALLVHAGIDWDWELPVLWIWFLAACGLAAARRVDDGHGRSVPRVVRVVAALAVLLLALTPWCVARSQAALSAASAEFRRGDCARTASLALDSLHALSSRPEPLELLGYCNIRAGRERLAVDAMRAAVRRDPRAWEPRYALALALAVSRRGSACGARDGADAQSAGGRGARVRGGPQGGAPVRNGRASLCARPSRAGEPQPASVREERRRNVPAASSTRPRMSTGIAAKPVNGRSPPVCAEAVNSVCSAAATSSGRLVAGRGACRLSRRARRPGRRRTARRWPGPRRRTRRPPDRRPPC